MFEDHHPSGQRARTQLPSPRERHISTSTQHVHDNSKAYVILSALLLVAFIAWVISLSRPREAVPALFSELWLSGSIHAQSEVTATCGDGVITIDNAADTYTSLSVPFRVQLAANTLAYGYYSLPSPAMDVRLELLDEHGASKQVFSVYEGSVDLRLEGIYLSVQLHDTHGAAVHISGQTFCSPS